MGDTPQQRENRTNSQSEEHVQSAIDGVLANQMQSYEEFMDSFLVLTQADVAEFAARRAAAAARNQNQAAQPEALASSTEMTGILSESSESQKDQHGKQKQDDDLEVEEIGDDIKSSEDVIMSSDTPRSSKYIQVDNYLDEPDSESEFISDKDEDDLDFDDSSSKYIASFDTQEGTAEGEAAKAEPRVIVTPEMLERVMDSGDIESGDVDTNTGEDVHVEQAPPFTGPYPGEVDDEIPTSPHPYQSVSGEHRITQLPHGTRLSASSEEAAITGDEDKVCLDEVQPFSIDQDFDYDNVILTPKWQPGEWPPSGT